MRLRHIVLATFATVLAASTTTATAIATTTDDRPLPVNTTASRLGASGGSETFTIDVHTGKVLSASKGPIFSPAISTQNSCTGDMACYTAPAPNTQQGFFGAPGTISGSWANRNGYNSGLYAVSACWIADLVSRCSSFVLNPGNRVAFNELVLGKSFTIHS